MSENDFSLDPTRFPRSLDLNLAPEVLEILRERARASGRSIDELILEILNRSLTSDHKTTQEKPGTGSES